jgi:spermidine synthase
LVRLYVIEVLGGLAALAVAGLLPAARMDTLLALNLVAMLAILTLLFPRVTVLRPALVILPAAYLLVWDPLHRASLEVFYRDIHGLTEPHVVASEYSRYQRVDLIRTGRETHLYLNGNLLYGTRALHVHNLMVATAPAWLAGGGRPAALLVAGGSLDNVRSLAPHTSSLDVVEIDETVVRLAREHIQDPRRGFPTTPWRLTIDDGRVFLADSPAPRYDLITLDLAVPTFAQSAQLYSPRFFALARQNLRAGGLLAVALGGKLDDVTTVRTEGGGSLPNRIVAGLSRTFAHVMVVRTGSRDYAWASDQPLRINSRDLQGRIDLHLEQLPEGRIIYGRPQITVLAEADVRAAGQSAAPVGDIDVRLALELSWRKLQSRLRDLTAKN